MEVTTLIIAVIALVIAILAFQRTGGIQDLRRQMDDITSKSEQATKGARESAADVLNRLESFIRGQSKTESQPLDSPEPTVKEEKEEGK